MKISPQDIRFLHRAFELAQRGVGLVSPGALVGAVLVKNKKVLSEGFYHYSRKKHAEVIAIEKAGAHAAGSTLYLNLEPCSHFGRTPPCADQVIQSGIQRVVCAMRDPNPRVSGKGFRRLQAAGIELNVGTLEKEAARLNEAFIKFITTQRPFVTLKAAMTLDGKIALAHQEKGSVTWITSEASRERVHQIRHAYDAILVGTNTILMDDPLLTDRSGRPRRRKLLRVVLDARLKTPLHSKLVKSANDDVLIFCAPTVNERKRRSFEERGVQIVSWPGTSPRASRHSSGLRWKSILRELARREIQSLLIEGGGETNWSAVKARVVDKFHFFVAPKILGGYGHVSVFGGSGFTSMTQAFQLRDLTVEDIAEDVLITAYPSEQR